MHKLHFDSDDFAAVMLQANILTTHVSPSGIVTHAAIYRDEKVCLIPEPKNSGGTIIMPAQPGEVGTHEMALDALKHGLIDLPEGQPPKPQIESQQLRHIGPSAFTQQDLDLLSRLHIVDMETWADELARTRVLQTDEPTGHSIVHFGIRDDGDLIVLVQADSLFLIFLPAEET